MSTCKVGVCDRDLDYSKAFMEYVNSDTSIGFQVVIFSEINNIRNYLESRSLDLIITDDTSQCERKGSEIFLTGVKVMEMSDIDSLNRGGRGNAINQSYIYRYQPVSEICKQIKRNLTAAVESVRNISDFICVYSPIGRCGKTRLAMTLAGIDEVRGGLYVGMENFSDKLEALSTNIIYPLKMNRPDLEEVIKQQIYAERGVYMSQMSGTYLDANDVERSEIEKLKYLLLKSGSFTTICFDIGSAALGDMSILDLFDRIYMPVLRDPVSVRKIEVFMKLLSDTGHQGVLDKLTVVDVPDSEEFSTEMIRTVYRLTNGDEDG
ncbi:MAG: hypothetical protein J5517_05050 [Eubacterium sp.]|nr:hypothetical protein [Eubacterium sp.]